MSLDLTFVAQIIVFVSMVALLWKLLYKPLNDVMEARNAKIAEGLAAAEEGLKAREKAEEEIKAQINEARAKAHEIISSAERRAAEINEEAINKARIEAEQVLDAAREEIAAEVARARQQLRQEIAEIAMQAAERVISAELDAQRHRQLIDSIIEQGLGSA